MPCVVRVMNSRRIWAEYITHVGEVLNVCKILFGNLKGGEHMQDICVDCREILGSLRRWEKSIKMGYKEIIKMGFKEMGFCGF
jgi:hypothetical protein